MATLTNEVKFSIKIIIDVKLKKVLFAETGKDFVDFIFSLMTLPLSSVTKLLSKKGMVGTLGSLYKSIESLQYQYYESYDGKYTNKDSVLVPNAPVVVPLLCLREGPNTTYAQTPRYVKEAVKYMVMDNLEVKPMSISLIRSLVKDFDFVEEKQVEFGLQEGLALLKASLENQAVLTSVFFEKKFQN